MTERERFEAWAQSRNMGLGVMVDGSYYHTAADEAWAAWQARCPEGWKCVPVEPTTEMVDAASEMYMPFGDMGAAIQAAVVYAPEEQQ